VVEVLTQKDADRHLLEQTERLAVTLDALDDLAVPSLCAGWSRAHVVAHPARNADGMSTMARSAHGEPLTMYASAAAREADIEAGARRPDRANIKDAITSGRRVRADLAGITPDVAGSTVHRLPGVPFGTAAEMSHRRLREVAYHHVDLDAGFSFADLPSDLQSAFLEDEIERLRQSTDAPGLEIRTSEGERWTIGDGSHLVTGPRAGVLAWLARGILIGLDETGATTPPRLPEGR
jgi:maleylpyruvate isomerase